MDKYIWPNGNHTEIEEWFNSNDRPRCELDKIGQCYNADKANTQWMSRGAPGNGNVPNDWPQGLILPIVGHNYLEIYSKYFEKNRNDYLKIVEIGMGVYPWNGYSMRMWLDYFPNCELHIIDIDSRNFNCNFEFNRSRVHFHICDQSSKESLMGFSSKFNESTFDYIIDDGSHIASHQYNTLKEFFPLLKSDGIYFIEDIHDEKSSDYILKLFESVNAGNLAGIFQSKKDIEGISSVELYRSLIAVKKGKPISR